MAMLNSNLKRFAAAAAANEDYAEDAQANLVSFQDLSETFPKAAKETTALAVKFGGGDGADSAAAYVVPDEAPQELLAKFDELSAAVTRGISTIESVVTFIQSRIPQVKEEDNIGVSCQLHVLEKFQAMLLLLECSDDKRRFVAIHGKAAYLKARGGIEKELKAAKADEQPHVGKSTALALRQLDVDEATDIARSFVVLRRVATQAALLVARNFSNLNQPRREGSNFIG